MCNATSPCLPMHHSSRALDGCTDECTAKPMGFAYFLPLVTFPGLGRVIVPPSTIGLWKTIVLLSLQYRTNNRPDTVLITGQNSRKLCKIKGIYFLQQDLLQPRRKPKRRSKDMKGTNSVHRDEENIPPIIQPILPKCLPFKQVQSRKHRFTQCLCTPLWC